MADEDVKQFDRMVDPGSDVYIPKIVDRGLTAGWLVAVAGLARD